MPSIALIAAFAGLTSLAAASPVEIEKRAGAFRVDQVQTGHSVRVGPAALQKVYQKYSKAVPTKVAAAAAAAAASGSVTASPEQYDAEYLCPVSIGGTTLNLDFDTGSADLWVFSSELPSSEQRGHSVYKTSSSKKKSGYSWEITYGDQSGASGDVYADTVVIGQVTATSQAVEAATSVSSQFTQDTDNDGLVGLAFSSINTVEPEAQTTFFDTVKSSLAKALFAADLKAGEAGSYDFGFVDDSKYTGDLDYSDVDNSQGFWMFTADGYAIGDSSKSTSLDGIADTGTTLLMLPDNVVSAYYDQVDGAQMDEQQGGYTFDCDATLPDFSLVINGNKHTTPGKYINYAPVEGSTCFGGIQSDEGVGFSIFGDIFLKSQYVVFDDSESSPRIGFGQQSS